MTYTDIKKKKRFVFVFCVDFALHVCLCTVCKANECTRG